MAFVRSHPWVTVKFCLLFGGIAAFVSYNFGGVAVGIPLATLVTTLAAVNRNIFDAASNAFLDIQEDDGTVELARKTASTALRRLFYAFLDYGLARLSIALVVAIKQVDFAHFDNFSQTWFGYHLPPMIMGFDIRFIAAMISMWLVVDLSTVLFSIALYERTGHDITLGRSYRRMANVIYTHSRKAGVVVFLHRLSGLKSQRHRLLAARPTEKVPGSLKSAYLPGPGGCFSDRKNFENPWFHGILSAGSMVLIVWIFKQIPDQRYSIKGTFAGEQRWIKAEEKLSW